MKNTLEILSGVSMLCLLLLILASVGCETDESRRELKKLTTMAAELPTYPDFLETERHTMGKNSRAMLYIIYGSNASLEEVTRFYASLLNERGWKGPQWEREHRRMDGVVGREFYFTQGHYRISITAEEPTTQTTYTVHYEWIQ